MTQEKPQHTFTITVDGQPKDIKMTFGLLNQLVRTIGDIESVADISFDIELREALLQECLAPRDENGRIEKEVNLFLIDVNPDDVIDLLDWVGAHVTDFLLAQMTRAKEMMEHRSDQVKALMPTSTGTPA